MGNTSNDIERAEAERARDEARAALDRAKLIVDEAEVFLWSVNVAKGDPAAGHHQG